jgi:hypothetical protein
MPTYVNAAVTRIQPYLARTPKLRLRRGASWMIIRATEEAQVDAWIKTLPETLLVLGVSRNPEAGHADGVISLEVPEGSEQEVAVSLLTYLRSELPGAELQAEWASGPTYVEAFRRGGRDIGDTLIALPPLADFPLAETCNSCRVDLRSGGNDDCSDCTRRDAEAGYRSINGHAEEPRALGMEKRLLDAVNAQVGRSLKPIATLELLAKFGAADGNRNHLGTVSADGNAMGAFFSALAQDPDAAPDLKRKISPEIGKAVFAALVEATAAIVRDQDEVLPVVPHVLGGDDLVVTVIADRAWPFATRLLTAFSSELTDRTAQWKLPDAVRATLPTMSAGLVFTQASYPYSRAVELAEGALRRAKQDLHGARPAISWLDVTVDGEQVPVWRRTLPLAELDRRREHLSELSEIGKSGRQALARLLASGSPLEADAAARVWARRNGIPIVPRLLDEDEDGVTRVRNLVALTTWWRP